MQASIAESRSVINFKPVISIDNIFPLACRYDVTVTSARDARGSGETRAPPLDFKGVTRAHMFAMLLRMRALQIWGGGRDQEGQSGIRGSLLRSSPS